MVSRHINFCQKHSVTSHEAKWCDIDVLPFFVGAKQLLGVNMLLSGEKRYGHS